MKRFAMNTDPTFMQLAIESAMLGRGRVEPNPMVGCVIVRDNRIIARGHHARFGGPHAEPNALSSATEPVAGATAYVTLEPCCHDGKKTPPCAPRLIAAGLARVVIGTLDPNPQVNGQGVAMLRAAGIQVDTGILEASCQQLLAPFHAFVTLGRPYVTLKWAQTSDGFIAGPKGQPVPISCPAGWHAVHQLRSDVDAILVGVQTAIADNPLLTVRHVPAHRPLLRCVLDRDLKIPLTSRLLHSPESGPVLIYCSRTALASDAAKKILARPQVSLMPLPSAPGEPSRLSLPAMLADLHHRNITHLLVEPGPSLAGSFFRQNAADRLWVIQSPYTLDQRIAAASTASSTNAIHGSPTGKASASKAPVGNTTPSDSTTPATPVAIPAPSLPDDAIPTGQVPLDADKLTEYLIGDSDAYFSPDPSADLMRAGHAGHHPTA